jgi:hypothetical protein
MIAVAVLAVLLGLAQLLARAGFGAWAGIQKADLFIVISVPTEEPRYYGWRHYVTRIHRVKTVALVTIGIVILAAAVYYRPRWWLRCSSGVAFHSARAPDTDESGAPERV